MILNYKCIDSIAKETEKKNICNQSPQTKSYISINFFHYQQIIEKFCNGTIMDIDNLFLLFQEPQFFYEEKFDCNAFLIKFGEIFEFSLQNDLFLADKLIMFLIEMLNICDYIIEKDPNLISIIQISVDYFTLTPVLHDSFIKLLITFIKNQESALFLINTDIIKQLISLLSDGKRRIQLFLLSLNMIHKLLMVLDVNHYQYLNNIIHIIVDYLPVPQYNDVLIQNVLPLLSLAVRNESIYETIKSSNFFRFFLNMENFAYLSIAEYSFSVINAMIIFGDIKLLNISKLYQSIIHKITENESYVNNNAFWQSISAFILSTIQYQSSLFLDTGLLPLLVSRFNMMNIMSKFETTKLISQYILCESYENICSLIECGGFFLFDEILCNIPDQDFTLLIRALIKIIELKLFENYDLNLENILQSVFNEFILDNTNYQEEFIKHLHYLWESLNSGNSNNFIQIAL